MMYDLSLSFKKNNLSYKAHVKLPIIAKCVKI